MQARTRQLLLAAVLLATLLAVYFMPEEAPVSRSKTPRETVAANSVPAATPVQASREVFSSEGGDLFAPHSWRPAPKAQPTAAAQPVIQAPPLPYTYTGRMEEAGKTVLFLSRGGSVALARVGDTLDGSYRLIRITPGGADFTYLPLNVTQSLNFAP